MTKNIAIFRRGSIEEVVAKLHELGFAYGNPYTKSISGGNAAGEEVLMATADEARGFLKEGCGVTMWRGKSEDLYLSVYHGKPHISFDGFTLEKEQQLVAELEELRISFSVVHEDAAYEG
jgi:hypothetical protein